MQFELLAPVLAVDALTAVALTLTPAWGRPGTYFGVRVAPDFRNTPPARRSRRRFTMAVWAATVVAAALSTAAPAAVTAGFLLQLGAAMVAFWSGWRETRPHAIAPASTRTAHLLTPRPRVPGGIAAVVTPFLILAGVALYLRAHWDAIPARFPIHWDLAGHANGWSHRTLAGVFWPILLGFSVAAFLYGLMAVQAHTMPRAPTGSGRERRNRAMLAILVIVIWIIAVMFSLAALTPLILRNGQFPIPIFVMVLVPLAAVAAGLWYAARASAESDDLPADNTPDECWEWGQLYYNRNDPAIMVEKRCGFGYTLNFARWQSWVILAAIVLVPAAIVLIASR